jgi:hypothetical protein
MNNKLKPVLVGGGALGVFLVVTVLMSAVPFLRFIGCCNCLWPIAGGLLATMMYIKGSPNPATVLDGAIVGALTGLIGGLIYLVIGLPISYFTNGVEAIDAQIRQLNPNFPLSGIVLMIVGGVVGFFLFIVLSTIGGLIAVPILEKRKTEVVLPPPPQDFGGGPGGSFGSGL